LEIHSRIDLIVVGFGKKIAEQMNGVSGADLKFILFVWDPLVMIIVIVCLISENEMRAMIDNKFEEEIYLDLI
jgi:hypothetical protein